VVPDDVTRTFWTRARRHLPGYGGEFVRFVPERAEGSFLIVATVRELVAKLDHLFSSML
jgi:2,2-dialkylglycine decarboxylase (pyruvate)